MRSPDTSPTWLCFNRHQPALNDPLYPNPARDPKNLFDPMTTQKIAMQSGRINAIDLGVVLLVRWRVYTGIYYVYAKVIEKIRRGIGRVHLILVRKRGDSLRILLHNSPFFCICSRLSHVLIFCADNFARRYSCFRVPFAELHCPQSSCRFSKWSVPPFDFGMI